MTEQMVPTDEVTESGFVARPTRHRPPLSVAVIEQLTHDIVTERYQPGTALPSAESLCETFSVSRTVIREATTTLAEKGLVAARQGWGTIVLDPSHWSLLDPMVLDALFRRADRLEYLDNLIEIRTTLECAMAARAARRITPDTAATLTRSFDQLASLLGQPAEYNVIDLEFHDAIHRIAGDRFGRAIVASIQGKALSSPMYTGKPTRAEIEMTHLAHGRIYNAVIAGDADEAATAMREHITESWARRRPRTASDQPLPVTL
jgi:GntR family transcriptional regulator, galactonate operon transcriptional repressor